MAVYLEPDTFVFTVQSSALPAQIESQGSPKTKLQGNHLKTITHQ